MSDDSNIDDLLFAEIGKALRSSSGARNERAQFAFPQIDNFEIVRELHRGGQGIVFEAMQQNPARRVALKVLLHGSFSSPQQRYRFEREVQLIASLNHPNIVTIFDSGTVDGQPFYVMEYLDGKPLNRDSRFERPNSGSPSECRRHIKKCLKLVQSVCEAVTCFQQRGLIHRDLKPENILLGSDGQPHIVDFGLARQSEVTTANSSQLQTQTGEFLGTLAYASPEQVSGKSDAVDTRSDVYALGVILYELLTGTLPHACDDSALEVLHRIAHDDAAAPSIANSAIDRDVDTIVLKALQRESEHRYQSAAQLAHDISQYLAGGPIEARRNSATYILRKTLRRHWVGFTTAAAFVVLLIASAVTAAILWQNAERELDRALQAEASEREARVEEAHHREEAEFRGYTASLAAAVGAIRAYRIHDAYDHLMQVPERLRAFEWRYVLSQIDLSIETWNTISGVHTLSQSADRSLLAVSGRDGSSHIIQANSGRTLVQLTDAGRVTALAFHPSNEIVVVGFESGELRDFDITNNEWSRTRTSVKGFVNNIEISPDGTRLIASAGLDPNSTGELTIRDFESDKVIVSEATWTHALDVGPDGQRLLTAGNDITVRNLSTGDLISSSDLGDSRCFHAQFSGDGSGVIAAASDQTIRTYTTDSLDEKSRFACQSARTTGLALHSEEPLAATCSSDGTVRLWDLRDGTEQSVFWGHLGWVYGVYFAPDETKLLSLDQYGAIKSWSSNVEVGDFRKDARGGTVNCVRYDSTGSTIATCANQNRIRLWDVASGKRVKTLRGDSGSVNQVRFSPDDRLLASACSDSTACLWNLESGQQRTLNGHTDEVLCLAFGPDADVVASGSKDGTVRVWDTHSGEQKHLLKSDDAAPIRSVDYIPDGQRLLLEKPGVVEVWRVSEERLERQWAIPINTFYATAALQPGGKLVAVGDDSGRIRLWDVDTGELNATIEYHAMALTALAFNPEGTRLVAASMDGVVKVWHVERRVELITLPSPGTIVRSIQFSPDGLRVAAGLHDGTMIWWETIPSSLRLGERLSPSGSGR